MPQFTLGDLQQRVYDRLDNNTALYPLYQVTTEINDALNVIQLFTGFQQTSVDVPGFTVARQLIYQVPTGILFPLRVYYEGRQLEKVSIRSISMRFRSWVTDQSNRGSPVQRWVPMGLGMFAIHPTDSVGGNNLQVNGFANLVPLVLPTDTVNIEDEWVSLVENFAAQTLPIKESPQIFSQASLLYQEAVRGLKQKLYWSEVKFPRYFVKMNAATQAEEMGDGSGS